MAPEYGKLNWTNHYFKPTLRVIQDVLIGRKRRLGPSPNPEAAPYDLLGPRATGAVYYEAVVEGLTHRRPRVVLIDEAQHFLRVGPGRNALDYVDVIKSIANRTQTVHILFGTFELLGLLDLSGQLSRRSIIVPFPRYHCDTPEEQKMFRHVLRTFALQLPLEEPPDLAGDWQFLYECTLGSLGLLKQLLVKAIASAYRENRLVLTRADLEKGALLPAQRNRILLEAAIGEKRLAGGGDLLPEECAILGLVPRVPPPRPPAPKTPTQDRKLHPGRRKPKRDPTGGSGNGSSNGSGSPS